MLPLHIHIAGGDIGNHRFEAERAQELCPERQQLEVVEAERQTDGRDRVRVAGRLAVAAELFELPFYR